MLQLKTMTKTNMYFEDNQDLAHDLQTIKSRLLDLPLSFVSDAGVFSKNTIDYGSRALIEAFRPQGKTLLDVGCGYGPIGLILAKKYDLAVTMSDINTRALDLAQKNSRTNSVKAEIINSDVYENVRGTFDNILTNPPIRAGKEVVHRILAEAREHLNEKGQLLVVIQKKQGAPSAQKKMQEIFGNCEIVTRDKGYYILKSIKE